MPDANNISRFSQLVMLRDELAVHNPLSERVAVLDWCIHVMTKIQNATDQIDYIKGCLK
jgi:hypothetical protein